MYFEYDCKNVCDKLGCYNCNFVYNIITRISDKTIFTLIKSDTNFVV